MVRFAFFWHQGFEKTDTTDFRIWFQTAADYGPSSFYNRTWSDYPPLNIYFFWLFGSLAKSLSLLGSSLFTYVMKLPPNLFDMATAFLIFVFVRKRLDFKLALLATSLYAFNPAVVFNAAVWGQFDAIYTFFLVLSLYLVFESKPKLAVVAFMLAILTKPQSIALAPLFVFLIFRKYDWKGLVDSIKAKAGKAAYAASSAYHSWKDFLVTLLVAVATVFAVITPFEWSNPVDFLGKIYFGAYSTYAFTTINAFNVWAFGGMWQPDTQFTFFLGWTMFGLLAVLAVYLVHKSHGASPELPVLFAAFVLFFGFFMLPTRIHERYLFPAMAVLALMFPFLKKMRPMYVVLTATCIINEAYVLGFLNAGTFIQLADPVTFTVSLINSLALLYVLMLMRSELSGKPWLSPSPSGTQTNASGG
jgi:Gpi18-like mannosyltransferase